MKNSLFIDSRFFRPLPQSMWDTPCFSCHRSISRWELHEPQGSIVGPSQPKEEFLTICSLCFLFESAWGKDRRDNILKMIEEVEEEIEVPFEKKDGKLLQSKDADRILGSIALVSRVMHLRVSNDDTQS